MIIQILTNIAVSKDRRHCDPSCLKMSGAFIAPFCREFNKELGVNDDGKICRCHNCRSAEPNNGIPIYEDPQDE